MRKLSSLAALASLTLGLALWMFGYPVVGTALAASSAVLVLVITTASPQADRVENGRLELTLDFLLIMAGLVGFLITKDFFFLSSAFIFLITNPDFKKKLMGFRNESSS